MSPLSDLVSSCATHRPARLALCLVAGAASLGAWSIIRSTRLSLGSHKIRVVPSPRESVLPHLSGDAFEHLPYPPNAFPGARDVDTPYGSIRVYEWGPEDGHAVLLIHGISTPSIALGPLARRLVESGCRVMLFGTSLPLLPPLHSLCRFSFQI